MHSRRPARVAAVHVFAPPRLHYFNCHHQRNDFWPRASQSSRANREGTRKTLLPAAIPRSREGSKGGGGEAKTGWKIFERGRESELPEKRWEERSWKASFRELDMAELPYIERARGRICVSYDGGGREREIGLRG